MRFFLVSQKFNNLSINKSKILKKFKTKKTESSITIQVIILIFIGL